LTLTRPLLEAHDLALSYPGRGLRRRQRVQAVDGVTLRVAAGEAVAVVGESGSGKSTLARLLLGLERPDRGEVRFDGCLLSGLPAARVRPLRRRLQAVFQDPSASLNPRLEVSTIVAEPLVAHGLGHRRAQRDRVREVLELVGLAAESADLFPGELSGGERQRVAIARALAPAPELLVLDEPVSSLDVVVQAQILDLLAALRERLALALVLVSHQLAVVRRVCDRTLVMAAGAIVEEGPTEAVLERPAHPATRALRAAEPRLGQPPSAPAPLPEPRAWPPGSCRWATCCPSAHSRCAVAPPVVEVEPGHLAACWLATPAEGP